MLNDWIDNKYSQLIGEFGLRENVYYGAIFLSMTFIVLFCFLIVNRFITKNISSVIMVMNILIPILIMAMALSWYFPRTSHGTNFHNAHQAIYDMGENISSQATTKLVTKIQSEMQVGPL